LGLKKIDEFLFALKKKKEKVKYNLLTRKLKSK